MRYPAHVVSGMGLAKGALVLGAHLPALHSVMPSLGWHEVPVILAAGLAGPLADGDDPRSFYGHLIPGRELHGHAGNVGRDTFGVVTWHRWRWHSWGAAVVAALVAGLLLAFVPLGPIVWAYLVAVLVIRSKRLLDYVLTGLIAAFALPPLFSTVLVNGWLIEHFGAGWPVWAAFGVLIAYLSHLLVDIPYGRQMIGWPLSSKLWRPSWLRVETGSFQGKALEVLAGGLAVLLLAPGAVTYLVRFA